MASKIISNTNNLTELSVEQITEARVTSCTPAIHLKVCHRYLLPSLLFALGALLSASALATPIHLLFERDADGQAGNELAVVSYPDLPSLISSTSSFTQFTQVDVSSAFSVGGITFDGSAYRTLFERDADGQAGNELAVVSYPSFADLIGSTNSFTQFTQVDVSSNFSVGGITFDGSAYRILFERDVDGQAGNELAVVSYPSFADLISSTNSFTQFTQVDVSSAFSVGGFDYDFDSGAYRLLFERNLDGAAGNELALVSYPSFADLIGSTNSFTQFTQVDVSSAFSVSGFYSDPPENQNVSEPVTLSLLVLGLLTIGLDSRVRKRLII